MELNNMQEMFADCYATGLNVSSFNTGKVAWMREMFMESEKLSTIYVGDEWTTASINTQYSVAGKDMFKDCNAIKGEYGQSYNAESVDYPMAYYGPGGYLWYKASTHPASLAGDANGDGKVNAADIVEVVNYLKGSPSARFNEKNADANDTGAVTVEDVEAIVGIILSEQ